MQVGAMTILNKSDLPKLFLMLKEWIIMIQKQYLGHSIHTIDVSTGKKSYKRWAKVFPVGGPKFPHVI